MTIPDFISTEQIARWDENIKNDKAVQALMTEELSKSSHFKEMLYASLWLSESMKEMGFDQLAIARISIHLGQQSFNSDPWIVAKILFDACAVVSEKINTAETIK